MKETAFTPFRTCIACRRKASQRELLRIVRLSSGNGIATRPNNQQLTTNKPVFGRSAYVCPAPTCIQRALERTRLAHALRTTIEPETKLRIEKDLECHLLRTNL